MKNEGCELTKSIEQNLFEKYGPLLSLSQLATVLHRSADGLRISLRSPSDCSNRINQARLRVGRRVYFRTSQIAEFLSACE